MKRVLSISLVALLLAAVIAACGSSSSQSNGESVSITLWTNFQVEADLLQQYADQWSDETGNTATVIHNSIELQQFAQATNSADGPDGIFGIANDQLASFVTANLAAEVPDDFYKDSDYVDAAVQASYMNGKRYGVPIAVETISLFYNTDKVDTPPTTWDELLQIAGENGGIKFDATSVYYDLGFLRAFDSYIFKWEDNAYDVDQIGLGNAGAVQGYDYIKRMVDEGFISADITFDIARSAFESGETAFFIGGAWDVDAFTSAGVNFRVAPMPTLNDRPFVTPVGTQVGFVSSKSKKQETVWDFYNYLIEKAAVDLYEVGGRIPAKLSVQQQVEMDEASESFMNQIANGEPLPTVPELGHLWGIYSDNMQLLFREEITSEEAAQYIESQLVEAIDLMHSGS